MRERRAGGCGRGGGGTNTNRHDDDDIYVVAAADAAAAEKRLGRQQPIDITVVQTVDEPTKKPQTNASIIQPPKVGSPTNAAR